MLRVSLSAALLLACLVQAARCDTVLLESGGRLEGTVVRDDDRSTLAVEWDGGRVVLDRTQVARITETPPEEAEYRRRAPTVPDNAEAQWAFAEWCRERGLSDQMRAHLQRVIELSPDHEEARKLLGYQRVNGRWLTRDDVLQARGLVRYDGRLRTPQEIALLKRSEAAQQEELNWKDRLTTWRRRLDDPEPQTALQARRQLVELRDPASAMALIELLREESNPDVALLLVQTAGYIDHSATVEELVRLSLEHPDREVRLACVEALLAADRQGLAAPYLRALESDDNAVINRAAEALGEIGDSGAVGPLIDALVTEHRFKIGADTGGGDTYSLNTATGQHSFGGGGPKIVKRELRNPQALSALVRLSGANFSYNQRAWREWLSARARAEPVDLRRDF